MLGKIRVCMGMFVEWGFQAYYVSFSDGGAESSFLLLWKTRIPLDCIKAKHFCSEGISSQKDLILTIKFCAASWVSFLLEFWGLPQCNNVQLEGRHFSMIRVSLFPYFARGLSAPCIVSPPFGWWLYFRVLPSRFSVQSFHTVKVFD